jgi:hypothetical protein
VPEFFTRTFSSDSNIPLQSLIVREATSLVLGCVIALVYRFTHGRRAEQPVPMMATLVLLTVLIGMISSVIGDNIARAFSLVGALAIVRFRTVVDDTRDTAFVIFAVGVGMAVGAGYLKVPLVCIPAATLAAVIFRPFDTGLPGNGAVRTLVVRGGLELPQPAALESVLRTQLATFRMTGVATVRQGSALERTYRVRLRPHTTGEELLKSLNGLEGVQGVELGAE